MLIMLKALGSTVYNLKMSQSLIITVLMNNSQKKTDTFHKNTP